MPHFIQIKFCFSIFFLSVFFCLYPGGKAHAIQRLLTSYNTLMGLTLPLGLASTCRVVCRTFLPRIAPTAFLPRKLSTKATRWLWRTDVVGCRWVLLKLERKQCVTNQKVVTLFTSYHSWYLVDFAHGQVNISL